MASSRAPSQDRDPRLRIRRPNSRAGQGSADVRAPPRSLHGPNSGSPRSACVVGASKVQRPPSRVRVRARRRPERSKVRPPESRRALQASIASVRPRSGLQPPAPRPSRTTVAKEEGASLQGPRSASGPRPQRGIPPPKSAKSRRPERPITAVRILSLSTLKIHLDCGIYHQPTLRRIR